MVISLVVEVISELVKGKVAFELMFDQVSDGLREVSEVSGLTLQVLFLILKGYEVDELIF